MISSEWLFQWKCFISNKISNSSAFSQAVKDRVNFSTNKEIGVLPPGPICNKDLYENIKEGFPTIKEGLVLNEDYRGVNKEVWDLLV